ncbi:ABC transporter substrate-binding protein [Rahnella bonaserana]|jgi:iron complex transport system substrate-binding protein|uniref:ABC transporter substrate-binding protein n=1 Tax=Rahnella bonaserana TaxID=2816248 RepID=A0ABS6LVI3_9GAMM|nr:ABC transporter substrate-binding protein [Rahnella bonaserana]MBU9856115.1 ABC transporter substrate-binding protein [Rahnella bonaserana]
MRKFSTSLLVSCLLFVGQGFAGLAQARTVTDITHRTVEVPDNPQRIVVGESRMLYTLALIQDGNPAQYVVGWPGDMAQLDAQSWALYVKAFPQIARIPLLGQNNYTQINAEQVIALKPDLVILPVYAKKQTDRDQMEITLTRAGIPVIYVDLRVDQLHNTIPSVKLLGDVLNHPQKAARFIAFYQQHMDRIRERITAYQGKRTSIMLQLHLGRREGCCTTVSHGNLADLLTFAGGDNIAKGAFPGVYGDLNAEKVIMANPDVYITTGMAGPEGKRVSNLMLGPQVTQQQAEQSFREVMDKQPVLSTLKAVREGRAYSVWHNFYLSPYHMVDVEVFAKAMYPQLFADVDPQQTMRDLYQQFLPIPFSGTYWATLPARTSR